MHLLLFSLPVLSGGGGLFYPGHFYAFNWAHCVNVSLFMGWMISFPGSLSECVRAHVACFVLIIKNRKCCFVSHLMEEYPPPLFTHIHAHTCGSFPNQLPYLPPSPNYVYYFSCRVANANSHLHGFLESVICCLDSSDCGSDHVPSLQLNFGLFCLECVCASAVLTPWTADLSIPTLCSLVQKQRCRCLHDDDFDDDGATFVFEFRWL